MIVGAREARRVLKRVGVRPDKEKGVVERGGSVATAVPGDVDCIRGLGLRAFSSIPPALRLVWSSMSVVLVVLRLVAV